MYRRDPENNKRLIGLGDKPHLQATTQFYAVINTLPRDLPVPLQLVKLGLLSEHLSVVGDTYEVNFTTNEIISGTNAKLSCKTLKSVWWFLSKITDELSDKRKKMIGDFVDETGMDRLPRQDSTTAEIKTAARDSFNQQIGFFDKSSSARNENIQTVSRSPPSETEYSEITTFSSASGENTRKLTDFEESTTSVENSDTHSHSSSKTGGDVSASSSTAADDEADSPDETSTDDVEQNPSHQGDSSASPFESGKRITKKGGERITGKNPFADTNMLKETGLHEGGG